ncbi:MAG: class I ribonucleotide reductase maintenance protein YfaE [Buchnera aphidicola (Schlechtendalia peitan)]
MLYSTITIHNKKCVIYYKIQKIPLLSVLQNNNIHIEYQCKQGYCGICRITLIKGNIYYARKQLPLASYNLGEIFPCCCIATGNIEINI